MQIAILSPHRDDAAFSCGLTLGALLGNRHTVTIVNVCTISRYAPYVAERTEELTQLTTAIRRREDEDFVETLCRTSAPESRQVELIDLEWKDVPIRWGIEDQQVVAALDLPPEEVHKLRESFCTLAEYDIVLVPMALGGHIDHRLVLQAAIQAFPVSSLVFYEDLPYACRMSAEQRVSTGLEVDVSRLEVWLPPSGSVIGLKKTYALCYPSQIAGDVADEMERYALEHSGKERFVAGPQAMRLLITALHEEVPRVIA